MKISTTLDSNGLVVKFNRDGVEFTLKEPIYESVFWEIVNDSKGVWLNDNSNFFFKRYSATGGGGTSIPIELFNWELKKPAFKWDVNLIEQFIDEKKLILHPEPIDANDTDPLLEDFFDLVDQWWDTNFKSINTYKWIFDNYFWDNLDKFNITMWWGDARTSLNTRVNAKQTFDAALLGRAPDANGIIFQTDYWDFNNNRFATFPRDNNNANYFYMLRFYKFNKNTMEIRGYHDRIKNRANPKENNPANAIKGFIVELK